jgi:hypothetical protein
VEGALNSTSFADSLSIGGYDEMGYFVAYPIEVLLQLLKDSIPYAINFVDKIEE